MKFSAIFSLSLSLVAACSTVPETKQEVPASVTVIFENCPTHSSSSRFPSSRATLPETVVDYVDSACVLRSYIPPQLGRDTIVIPAWGGYAEILHKNQAIENIFYLLEAGDTVAFTYGKNLRPRIRSLCSGRRTWLYNLAEEDPRAVQQATGYSTRTTCTSYFYRHMWQALQNSAPGQAQETRESLAAFRRYCPNLDSLQKVFEAYETDYGARIDTLERSGHITPRYADYLRGRHCPPGGQETDSLVLKSDSLMHYPFAHYLARRLTPYRFTAEDCSRIARDSSLARYARIAMLRWLMWRVTTGDGGWTHYPHEIVEACNAVYIGLTGDTTYTPESIVGRACTENGYTNDMVLEDASGERHDYGDILRTHRGKVIYIDLWASWCAPCRAEMPAAVELRRDYADKGVVFLYLAVDDTRAKWLAAVAECHTGEVGGINYLVLNARDSKFLKEVQHRRIPHLLLYDREGKLVNPDAPRPGDKRIRDELDKLLE